MKQRVLTASVILPIFLFVMFSRNDVLFYCFIGLLSILALNEYYVSFNNLNKTFKLLGLLGAGFYIIFIIPRIDKLLILFLLIFSFIILTLAILKYDDNSIKNAGITILGFIYIPFLFTFTILMYSKDDLGYIATWLIFLIAWVTDTSACLIGSKIGKRKITPILSPKKSLEGFIGGTICTIVISSLFGFTMVKLGYISVDNFVGLCFVVGFIGSIVSQIGDLVASAIKRQNKIKDYGNIFPGHGGVLDRFDSVLFVAPTVYFISVLLL